MQLSDKAGTSNIASYTTFAEAFDKAKLMVMIECIVLIQEYYHLVSIKVPKITVNQTLRYVDGGGFYIQADVNTYGKTATNIVVLFNGAAQTIATTSFVSI